MLIFRLNMIRSLTFIVFLVSLTFVQGSSRNHKYPIVEDSLKSNELSKSTAVEKIFDFYSRREMNDAGLIFLHYDIVGTRIITGGEILPDSIVEKYHQLFRDRRLIVRESGGTHDNLDKKLENALIDYKQSKMLPIAKLMKVNILKMDMIEQGTMCRVIYNAIYELNDIGKLSGSTKPIILNRSILLRKYEDGWRVH